MWSFGCSGNAKRCVLVVLQRSPGLFFRQMALIKVSGTGEIAKLVSQIKNDPVGADLRPKQRFVVGYPQRTASIPSQKNQTLASY